MKKKLLVLTMFMICYISFSQNTYVPDDNFEQALIDLGYDSGLLDDYVPTANINTVTELNISGKNISNLAGIEDFIQLTELNCSGNLLSSLDVSQNTLLTNLNCSNNLLTSFDISQNGAMLELNCSNNLLTNLNVSQSSSLMTVLNCSYNQLGDIDLSLLTKLAELRCSNNQLSDLDVSVNDELSLLYCGMNKLTTLELRQNILLEYFWCNSNDLTTLDIKNGYNTIILDFVAVNNPNLTCIEVDDETYSTNTWFNIDAQTSFSEDCSALDVDDYVLAGFNMYPNPSFDIITISIQEEANYRIVNLSGQVLKNGHLYFGDNMLNISQLSDGLYFMNITTDKGFICQKIMKQ